MNLEIMSYNPEEIEGSNKYKMNHYKYAERFHSDNEIFGNTGVPIPPIPIKTTQRYNASTKDKKRLERPVQLKINYNHE